MDTNTTPPQGGPHQTPPNSTSMVMRRGGQALVLDAHLSGPIAVDNTTDTVVVVEVEHDTFKLSARLLREYSALFEHLLSDTWREPKKVQQPIKFHKSKAVTFELFADWLNHGTVFISPERSIVKLPYVLLFNAVVLGHTLSAPKFSNFIMDIITAKIDAGHAPDKILPKIAYEGTPPGSPLRRILIDVYAYRGGHVFVSDPACQVYIHKDFLTDLVCALYNLRDTQHATQPFPFSLQTAGCKYHNHGLHGSGDCMGPKLPGASEAEDHPISDAPPATLLPGLTDAAAAVITPTMSCHASNTDDPGTGTGNYVRVTNGSYGLIEEVPDDYVPRRINRPPVQRELTPFDSLTPITSRRFNKDAANNTRDSGMGESFISSIAPQDMGLTPARNNSASPCPAPTNAAAAATLGAPQDTPQEHLPPPSIKRERDADGDTEDPANTSGGVSLKKKAKKRLTAAEKEEKKRLQELKLKRMEELRAQGGESMDQPFALDD